MISIQKLILIHILECIIKYIMHIKFVKMYTIFINKLIIIFNKILT